MDGQIQESIDAVELAGRGVRFLAYFVDSVILVAILMLMNSGIENIGIDFTTNVDPIAFTVASFLQAILVFAILNGYLLYSRGQTIGKWLFRIAIISHDGTPANFWNVLCFRYVAFWIGVSLPYVGNALFFIDPAFIFSNDRRCLHDMLAGTIVVKKRR